MTNPNRIDPTPARLSTNVSIERQTPKRDFGDRVRAGLDQTTGAIANGAAMVGGLIPGGAIVSAAISSVTGITNGTSPGAGGGTTSTSHYGASGVTQLGGGTGGGINTTVGGGQSYGGVGFGSTVGGSANYATGGAAGNNLGEMNSSLINSQKENAEMMRLQMSMQRENLVFTSVSNVLKTRHDTAKNSISNVR